METPKGCVSFYGRALLLNSPLPLLALFLEGRIRRPRHQSDVSSAVKRVKNAVKVCVNSSGEGAIIEMRVSHSLSFELLCKRYYGGFWCAVDKGEGFGGRKFITPITKMSRSGFNSFAAAGKKTEGPQRKQRTQRRRRSRFKLEWASGGMGQTNGSLRSSLTAEDRQAGCPLASRARGDFTSSNKMNALTLIKCWAACAPCPCRTPKVCPNFVHVQRLS